MAELPTNEDIREYTFNSLKQSNQRQKDVIGKYIDKLNIFEYLDEQGNLVELLNPNDTYNPHLQVLYDNIITRGLSENPLLEPIRIRPEIEEYVYAERRTHPLVRELEEEMQEAF